MNYKVRRIFSEDGQIVNDQELLGDSRLSDDAKVVYFAIKTITQNPERLPDTSPENISKVLRKDYHLVQNCIEDLKDLGWCEEEK